MAKAIAKKLAQQLRKAEDKFGVNQCPTVNPNEGV